MADSSHGDGNLSLELHSLNYPSSQNSSNYQDSTKKENEKPEDMPGTLVEPKPLLSSRWEKSFPTSEIIKNKERPVPKPRKLPNQSSGPHFSAPVPVVPSGSSANGTVKRFLPAILSEFATKSTQSLPNNPAGVVAPQPTPRLSLTPMSAEDDERMFKLRDYQVEISQNVLNNRNDIIVLPTGTGKTPVAVAAILKCLRRGSRKKKVLFLAPRVVLAEQQLEVIKSHLPLEWASKCRKLTGGDIDSMDDLQQILTGDEWSVIVATPQTVFNYFLAFESSTMTLFSLIVFDEAHNATGMHVYNRLLFQYGDEKFINFKQRDNLPQIIGLTASVGLGEAKTETAAVDYMQSFCARLDVSQHPAEVIKYREELEAIRNPPFEVERKVEEMRTDPLSEQIKKVMSEILDDVKVKLKSSRALTKINFHPGSDFTSQKFEQSCVNAGNDLSTIHDSGPNDMARDCIISLKHLRIYGQALKWANLAREVDAVSFLDEELSGAELSGNQFAEKYRSVWREQLQELAEREDEHPNDKLHVLKEELDKALSAENCKSGESPRVMIFVEYRRLAYMIRDWILTLGPDYKAERYVSSLARQGDFGMAPEEARSVMTRFRDGELNILVATSVLSEGVDIPECNGTIRYLYMKDVIAEVQVPGRMRAWGGRVVAILTEKLRKTYRENKSKEQLMAKALERIREIPLETFMKRMEDEQERAFRARQEEKKRRPLVPGGERRPADNAINCQQCGRRTGQLSDVHRYMEAHYIVLSKDLLESVDVTEGPEFSGVPMDGMVDTGILVCKDRNCNAELGKVIKIKIGQQTRKLGIWDINKIRVLGSSGNFSKWDDVSKKYMIPDIKQERLRAMIDSGHYIEMNAR